jgi:hypothetical protein
LGGKEVRLLASLPLDPTLSSNRSVCALILLFLPLDLIGAVVVVVVVDD